MGTLDDSNDFTGIWEDIDRAWWLVALGNLGANLESAATCAALYRLGYTKGFSDSQLLKSFCEEYVPEPYFPIADNRPTAERLGWINTECRHMWGEEGSCARCEGT